MWYAYAVFLLFLFLFLLRTWHLQGTCSCGDICLSDFILVSHRLSHAPPQSANAAIDLSVAQLPE